MRAMDGSWKTFGMRAAVLGVVIFAAVRAAHAWEGRPGVEARSFLTVAGALTGVATSPVPTMRFTFHKVGGTDCPADAVGVSYNGSTFSAQVPYDACGRGYFDGANVTVDVSVNGTPVVTGQAVNPVPYAQFANQYGTPDCPVGYERATDAAFTGPMRRCQHRRMVEGREVIEDEVVRVGMGASAFWIDRYEAIVYEGPSGMTSRYGDNPAAPYPVDFSPNGQSAYEMYALSRTEGRPSRFITWFQAQRACRASGKRLPSSEEWLAAARGTPDGPPSDGGDGRCVTTSIPGAPTPAPRDIAHRARCQSRWGAQDMIGNVWEWTGEWDATVATAAADTGDRSWQPEADYGNDITVGVTSFVGQTGVGAAGMPAAVLRGGAFERGAGAGVFALGLYRGPGYSGNNVGFRCVIPR